MCSLGIVSEASSEFLQRGDLVANHLIESLRWDEVHRQWEGVVRFYSGHSAAVYVEVPEEPNYYSVATQEALDAVQAFSRNQLFWLQSNEQSVYTTIATDSLPYYNHNQTADRVLSLQELAGLMRVTHIRFQLHKKAFLLIFSAVDDAGGSSAECWFDENHQLEYHFF